MLIIRYVHKTAFYEELLKFTLEVKVFVQIFTLNNFCAIDLQKNFGPNGPMQWEIGLT
jgi:hypothetical protein